MEGLAELARTGGPAWALLVALRLAAIVYLFRQLSKEREMCANDWRTTVAGNRRHQGMVDRQRTPNQGIRGKCQSS
jgi:hypothetical protein